MEPEENHRPSPWNKLKAAEVLGKYVLIGISHMNSGELVVRREQKHGEIVSADPHYGICVRLDNGEHYWLPPALEWLLPAPLGTYALKDNEGAVEDPDYLCTINLWPREAQGN